MKKIGLFFGGLSNEAAVSIMSAKNVVQYFNYRRYKLVLIYWQKSDRRFYLVKNLADLKSGFRQKIVIEDFAKLFDIALLMTHGRYGEDGVLQAILVSQNIKYCGCQVLSSALCMDKAIFKDLIAARGYQQVKYTYLDFASHSAAEIKKFKAEISSKFKLPIYVKPANSGSSVGITAVTKINKLALAIQEALKHDSKILIEEGLVQPQEIEVAVVGNNKLVVSQPGELKLAKEFYDYDDKYKRGEAKVVIPARLDQPLIKEIRTLAERIYRLMACRGFARVDFFVSRNKIYISEINTLPGFTDISMFPKLMMNSGRSYTELLDEIIELAA